MGGQSIGNNGPPMPWRSVTLLCLAALALAGCGERAEAERVRDRRAAITLDDFMIRPQTVRAEKGRITFEVRNAGRLGHNFRVRGQGNREWVQITTLQPGETGSETVRLPAGDYRMFCSVANHEELGEWGTLVVR
jgi:plastocyanin